MNQYRDAESFQTRNEADNALVARYHASRERLRGA